MASAQDEARSWVEGCLRGDPGAWEALVRSYTPLLAAAIRDTLRRFDVRPEPARVQDLLQETFLSLARSDAAALRGFQWECPLERYLVSVGVHRTIDNVRREGKFEREGRAGERRLADELLASLPSEAPPPEPFSELQDAVAAAVARLGDRERLAVKLFYWESMPVDRIARMLGIGTDSVWMVLSRARARLKECLKGISMLL